MSATNEVRIDRDSVRYGDDIIRVSNISRMYMIQFFNRKKKKYEDDLKKYEDGKRIYEILEKNRKNSRLCIFIIAAICLFLLGIFFLRQTGHAVEQNMTVKTAGMFCVGIGAVCVLAAILTAGKKIVYNHEPPEKGDFPENYGLVIEMNSGQSVIFKALDEIGKENLRTFRDNINDAAQQQPFTFNLTEHHIQMETNEGAIVIGDNAQHIVNQEGMD